MPKRLKKSSKKKSDVKLKKVDWLGLKHDAVIKHFEGDLSFVNYMNVGERGDLVAAVYHAKKPNRDKGHKEFMLLWQKYDPISDESHLMVSGMDRDQIEKHAKVTGLLCLDCRQALFSLNRHHMHSCGCDNDMFVDGGKDYLRAGAKSLARTATVTINLLTDEVVLDKKAKVE